MTLPIKSLLVGTLLFGADAPVRGGTPWDIAFVATHDQSEQRYALVLPKGFDGSRPLDLLVCLHGHGADRWQFVQDERAETRAARDFATRHGMVLVAPDYRAPTSWMGPAAEADLVQVLGDLRRQFPIRRSILVGGSMGAAGALTFTALHPELVDGVVAYNGHANHLEYTNFQDAIQVSFGGTKDAVPAEYRKRSAELHPERFTMPVALTAGGQDTVVPPNSVVRLGRALQPRNPAVRIDFEEARGHETEYAAAMAACEFVLHALDAAPLRVGIQINGVPVLPAPGSAAGVWFHTPGQDGSQVLLTGHTGVPGSWRMTVAVNAGDEIRLCFPPHRIDGDRLRFRAEPLSVAAPQWRVEANAIVVTAGTNAGALRFAGFATAGTPLDLIPERRPFSRAPVAVSPDPRPAIAEALIEWDWRMQDGIQTPRDPRSYRQALEKLIGQTTALVAERRRLETLHPDDDAAFEVLRTAALPAEENSVAAEDRWLAWHRLRRQMALSNPLFQGSPLLFAKHVPSVMSHQLTQVYGYCARPGGGLFALTEPGRSMRTRDLTPPGLVAGNFMTPEVTFDGSKVLFAYCPVREAPDSWDFNDQTASRRYHIFELTPASGAVRPLTQGDTDNFSPVALPSGDVLFVSTRRGGYHRCGRGPCFVYTLARMAADGAGVRSVSFHETHEWDPCLLNDGRVVYTRWDYVDRNAVQYEQLWSAFPDGRDARIYYGNNTWNPTGTWEARAIPGSTRIMATAAPHHGMTAGSIVLVDTTRGVDGPQPLTRLTPDVRFPESESPLAFGPNPVAFDFDTPVTQYWRSPLVEPWREQTAPEEERRWPGHCYKSPWPLSESFFIVSYSFDGLVGEPGPNLPNMFGLYFADAFGNKELIYRDPAISSLWARPLAPRTPPPDVTRPALEADDGQGTFLVGNVRDGWPYLPETNAIAQLRIIQVLLKTTPNADAPRVGAAFAAPGKQVLGTVPVEPDGSAYFTVPARTPVLFQALDNHGRAVQTMRSLVYLQPGEHQSCVGCHEHRLKTPARTTPPLAIRRPPSKIKPGPEGSRPFSYPRLVQPVLDRHCVSCHDGREPGRPVLTGEPEGGFTKSYNALVSRVAFSAWNRPEQNFEPMTTPLRFGALASPLGKMLAEGHSKLVLPPEDMERLVTWMDANALFYGTFDVREQQKQIAGDVIAGPNE
jgi:predicted esterase